MRRAISAPDGLSRGDEGPTQAGRPGLNDLDKTCGVCLEPVLRKANPRERVFGILPHCNHCFCVTCIRKWRRERSAQANKCPECRTVFPFYVPHGRWPRDGPEKRSLVERHREVANCRRSGDLEGEPFARPYAAECFHCARDHWRNVDGFGCHGVCSGRAGARGARSRRQAPSPWQTPSFVPVPPFVEVGGCHPARGGWRGARQDVRCPTWRVIGSPSFNFAPVPLLPQPPQPLPPPPPPLPAPHYMQWIPF